MTACAPNLAPMNLLRSSVHGSHPVSDTVLTSSATNVGLTTRPGHAPGHQTKEPT